MSTETTTERGFTLRCPSCGEEHGITLDLADLDTLRCRECDNEFTVADVRQLVKEWTRFLRWLDAVPTQE